MDTMSITLYRMKSRIKYVSRIQVIRDNSEPGLLAIRVEGIADLNTILKPILVPKKYNTEPKDGIFELDFNLQEGDEGISDVELEVQVIIRLKNIPDWVKGVRINAERNSDIELI
jgi:hypothetical protein